MAQLNEQHINIKVSELLKDGDEPKVILTDDIVSQLEAVISELAGPGKLVEIIRN
jgi:hypothetical protein|tara:strand:+ start:848 stop:1012 length:165 start_codon:yes stop_codon:yes gene_type:complete